MASSSKPGGASSDVTDAYLDVLGVLGRGSYSVVEKVRTATGTVLARKSIWILRHRDAEEVVEVARKEAGIVQRLRHAHVISVLGVVMQPSSIGMLMLPVADCDLSDFFAKCTDDGYPTDRLALLAQWFACLSNSLTYIHSQGSRHKDIKPANILVQGDLVYYTDFGLAKDFDPEAESFTEGHVFAKTPMYSPPEVISEEKQSRSADFFSLGCVFAEMATILGKRSVKDFHNFRASGKGSPLTTRLWI
jgi:serine/threonine protein kinase